MTRIVIAFALLAVLASAATITPTTNSLTSGSFASPPGKVADASSATATDYTKWSTYTKLWFGPGTVNTTAYVYAIAATATSWTAVASRSLNATLLGNGTADTTMASVITSADTATTIAITTTAYPVAGVGLGSIAYAYVAADTATIPCNQVYLSVYNGGSSSALNTIKLTSNTCAYCKYASSTDLQAGVRYDATVGNVFYENGTYFVVYTNTKSTITPTATGDANCPTTAPTTAPASTATFTAWEVKSTYQGVAATAAGTLTWTTAPTIYSATTQTPTAATLAVQCGPQNFSNSTTHYCVYKDGSTSTSNLKAIPVTVSSGSAGSAITIATDATTTAGTYPLTTNTFSVSGFVYSQYQQGILINNYTLTTSASTGATYTYANTLQLYNLTSGATATAGGVALSGLTNTVGTGGTSSAQYAGAGVNYGLGFMVLDRYQSATTPTYSWEYTRYFANSTVNVTKVTTGTSSDGAGNWYADANGDLWFGAYTTDTANSFGIITANVGKLVASLYNAGNVLASFFALISLMIAALFAF